MVIRNITRNNKGFTIVETIVAFFLFSIVALSVTTILIRAMNIKRRVFAAQIVQENVLSVFGLISKEVRVSAISNQNNNCTTDPALSSLTIIHPEEGTILYRLSGGVVERVVGVNVYQISSPDVNFDSLRFCVLGSTLPSDNQQTRVAILAQISSKGSSSVLVTLKLQTTIDTRDIFDEIQNP